MGFSPSSGYGFLGVALAAAGLAWVWTWLVSRPVLRHLRHRQEVHWTETARLIHPHRGAVGIVAAHLPGVLALAAYLGLDYALVPSLCVGFAASIGASLGAWPVVRALHPEVTLGIRRQLLSSWRHPAVLYGCVLFIMPSRLGPGAWALFAFCIVLYCAQTLWPMRVIRLLRGISPAPASISGTAHAWANHMGATLRGVWVMETPEAAAWAYCVSKDILLTRGIVQKLPESELESILIHELEHLRESTGMILARLVAGASWMPILLLKPVCGTWGQMGIGPILLCWVCVPWLVGKMAIRKEIRADAAAAHADPAVHARALTRLHELNLIPAVVESNSTHPNLYDRLLAVGITPDFPRPKAANVLTPSGALTSGLLGLLTILAVGRWLNGG